MMGLCCFILIDLFIYLFYLILPFHVQRLVSSPPPPPPQLLVVSHVAVMLLLLLLLFTTGRLTLIFALPWLSVLCWLLFTSCPSSLSLLLPLSVPSSHRLTCNNLFHASSSFFFCSFFFFDLPSPSSSPLPLSPSFFFFFLTLVMSALACFGVTNHLLQKKPTIYAQNQNAHPTQKPCITIGCFLLATTHLALCLLLRVRPPACPALPCPDWWLLLRALSVIGCADGERVVHQNMGFLLTGTTSVRSVSTKSRVRVFPWEMTPPSLRRKYPFNWASRISGVNEHNWRNFFCQFRKVFFYFQQLT